MQITEILLYLRGRDDIEHCALIIITIIAFIIKIVYITFNFKDSYGGTIEGNFTRVQTRNESQFVIISCRL